MPRSTTARGYGATHQATRKRLQRVIDAGGVACARCGCSILPGMEWHLDHAPGKTSYLGPSHKKCNLSAGGREGAAITNHARRRTTVPAGKRVWSRVWFEPIPDNVIVFSGEER